MQKIKDNILTLSNADLTQHFYNAVTTAAQAGGHGKANANERVASLYAEALRERNLLVPDNKVCYTNGTFNGVGSV